MADEERGMLRSGGVDAPSLGDVLVAHHDAKVRTSLRLSLQRRNLRAVEAHTPARALRLAQTQVFRIAIIGREFPGDEGGELIQEIVRHRPLLPMVIVNSSRSVDAAIFAKRIGAISVSTPIDEEKVGHIARRILEASGIGVETGDNGVQLPFSSIGGYNFIRGLGPGGNNSMVVLAEPPIRLGVPQVALKVLEGSKLPADIRNDRLCDFLEEARRAAELKVTGLVPILDYGYDETVDAAWVAYQFVDGFSLGHHFATSRLPLARKLEVLAEICRILSPLHRSGLVHGNLRPSSILIDSMGQLLLTNHGEGIRDTRELTVEAARYVSPEVIAGVRTDARSDLFSLGAVGYRLICGVPPFDGETPPAVLAAVAIMHPAHPRHHVPHLPTAAGAVLRRMLNKAPQERFQTAEEARDALREAAYLTDAASESANVNTTAADRTTNPGTTTWFKNYEEMIP